MAGPLDHSQPPVSHPLLTQAIPLLPGLWDHPHLGRNIDNGDNSTGPPLEAAILSNLFIAMIIVGFDASRHNWFRHKDGPVPEKDVPSQNIVLMGKKTFLVLQVLLSVISLKFYSFLSTIG